MTLNNNTPKTPDVIESHPLLSTVNSSLTDTVNSSGLPKNILDSDPRSAEILGSDPTSHGMILEHVNPLCTTDLLLTDSYDIYDAEDIDSYFDCLTDSKSWDESDICDILNDTEVHEVVEDLIAKVVEIASNQEKFKTHTDVDSEVKEVIKVMKIFKSCALIRSDSENVEIENKDQYENDDDHDYIKDNNNKITNDDDERCEGGGGPDGDSDGSALSRYENDVSAGLDDVAHRDSYIWQTARRWTAATVKVLLGALIEYVYFILPSYHHNSFTLPTQPFLPYHTLPCPAPKRLNMFMHVRMDTRMYYIYTP